MYWSELVKVVFFFFGSSFAHCFKFISLKSIYLSAIVKLPFIRRTDSHTCKKNIVYHALGGVSIVL